MQSSAKKLYRVLSSGEIRKTFIDYFIVNHNHKFVRSSPVVPFCDPTVAFVNAGMNQFKSVFLGKMQPPHRRVANSQKCIRVGGKHNDLSVVGQDGYHHTFFEMLGNWSFGDYFKREACEMALDLLRGSYNIDQNRLYVTYFVGDKVLGLPADLECFHIWRSLGFPTERIIPFGTKDNFWEMGPTGPCGPCTEIHIDHRTDVTNAAERAKYVNAGMSDLTELWNLVFIQYNRNEDGTLSKLPSYNVDTGMGFERLTAILQNKNSNYDTDIFMPIFDVIQKETKVPAYIGMFPTREDGANLDTAYRILADHLRMVTVALADGMLPDQNQKLRRILRKALTISDTVFGDPKLLPKLVPVVIETLGVAYPEMCTKEKAIIELMQHENFVFQSLRETSSKGFTEILSKYPHLDDVELMDAHGFVPAYRDFQEQKHTFEANIIPGEFLYRLTDTYGLVEEHFKKLAELENLDCDMVGYREEMQKAKLRAKCASNKKSPSEVDFLNAEENLITLTASLPATDNSSKYHYNYDYEKRHFNIPSITAKILGISHNGKNIDNLSGDCITNNDDFIYVITDNSNFYYESGGQQSDRGKILTSSKPKANTALDVLDVKFMNGCVIHICKLQAGDKFPFELNVDPNFTLQVGKEVQLMVDQDYRTLNACHHTACHLLNAAIRCLFDKVTYQVSSAVTSENCKLELCLLGKRMTKEDVEQVEDLIGRVICASLPVETSIVNSSDVLQQGDITMVPGEVYPEENLRLVKVSDEDLHITSKELCCGTHVTNTKQLEYFCIANVKQTNRARYAFTAYAGTAAEKALKTAALLSHRINMLEKQFKTDKLTNATEGELQTIRNNILHTDIMLPHNFKTEAVERITDLLNKLKESTRTTLKEFVEVEMRNLLQEKPLPSHPFILHYISSSALVEEVPLQKATRLCNDRPILVIGMCGSIVKARCCVPQDYVSKNFDAQKWLQEFAATFKTQVTSSRGQNPQRVCNMRAKKIPSQFEEQLEIAMAKAFEFASKHFTR